MLAAAGSRREGASMAAPLDRRTRRDSDLRTVLPAEFFGDLLPGLLERNAGQMAAGIRHLQAPPLTVELGDRTCSFSAADEATDPVAVTHGAVDHALVVTLTDEQFSDWVQQQRTFNGFMVGRELTYRDGDQRDVSVWDALWLTLLEGWPVVDDDLRFVDGQGAPLDLSRGFTPDDDPDEVAHFLREAGYLRLVGWYDPDLLATVSQDMDRAVASYANGDGKSWWAVLADGSETCVRMQEFLEHSPAAASILAGDRWDQIRRTIAGPDDLIRPDLGPRALEALIKPVGVVAGPSDLTFHRDCHLGRHAYECSRVTIGISVTPSTPANGTLRVVAGSHRVAMPVEVAKTEPYLPVVALPTEPGDLTLHLSCTLHESLAPVTAERRVMYTPAFNLAPRPGDGGGGAEQAELRERVFQILLDEAGSDALPAG
jgi:hypothetical protein